MLGILSTPSPRPPFSADVLYRSPTPDKKIGPHLRTANPQLRYLTLLYNNGHYDSLADLASEENSASLSHAQWPIVMAALYKIGTREPESGCDFLY